MIAHHALLYRDLADPLALLTAPGGPDGNSLLARFWAYDGELGVTGCITPTDAAPPTTAWAYSALMAATQPMIFDQIVGSYPFARHRAMLDIGGGSGAFAQAVAQHAPALTVALFDLPQVAALSEQRLAESTTSTRIAIHAGSFKTDPLPPGYDLMTLVRILHDHNDPVVCALLRTVYAALPPGGRLLIAEPMAATRGAQAMGDGYFGLYLWAMGSGRPRSASGYRDMLAQAGFARVREVATPLPIVCRMLVAEK
jgi:demethylspheroidene O-methyltransferase